MKKQWIEKHIFVSSTEEAPQYPPNNTLAPALQGLPSLAPFILYRNNIVSGSESLDSGHNASSPHSLSLAIRYRHIIILFFEFFDEC